LSMKIEVFSSERVDRAPGTWVTRPFCIQEKKRAGKERVGRRERWVPYWTAKVICGRGKEG